MAVRLNNLRASGFLKIFGSLSGGSGGGQEPAQVTPGGSIATTQDVNYVGKLVNTFGSSTARFPFVSSALISDDGTFVHWDGNDSPVIGTNITDMSEKWRITEADVLADFNASGFPYDPTLESNYNHPPMYGMLLPDRKHVFVYLNRYGSSPQDFISVWAILYDISSGTPVPTYGSMHRASNTWGNGDYLRPAPAVLVSLTEGQTDDDNIIVWFYRNATVRGARLPSINEYRSGHIVEPEMTAWTDRVFMLDQETDGRALGVHGSLMEEEAGHRGFMLPYSQQLYTRLWWMNNKSDMLYHADTNNTIRNAYLSNVAGTYPDGLLLSDTLKLTPDEELNWWQLILKIISLGFYDPWSDEGGIDRDLDAQNHRLVDTNGVQVYPFDDAFLDWEGNYTTTGEQDYLWRPTIRKVSNGYYLVIFAKKFEGTAAGPSGARSTMRAFLFDPYTQQFVQHVEQTYVPYDVVTDIGGVTEMNRYSGDRIHLSVDYYPGNGKYYEIAYHSHTHGDGDMASHWTLTEVGTMTVTAPGVVSWIVMGGLELTGETSTLIIDGDPLYEQMVLDMTFSGVDGSTSFTDESKSRHAFTANSTAQITGDRLVLADSDDYIVTPDHPDFTLGSGDFTLELFNTAFNSAVDDQYIVSHYDSYSPGGNQRAWIFRASPTAGTIQFYGNSNGGTGGHQTILQTNWTPVLGQEYNLTVERSGDVWRIYVDGTMIGTSTLAFTIADTAANFAIGAGNTMSTGNEQGFIGSIGAIKLTLAARYASDTGYVVAPATIQGNLINGDASQGTTGWTSYIGDGPKLVVGRTGDGFAGATSTARGWWGQDVDVPALYHDAVDTGRYKAVVNAWRSGYTDSDNMAMMLDFYDATGNWLAGRVGEFTDPADWTEETFEAHCPIGTASVRVSFRSVRAAGTELSAYIDDIEVNLYRLYNRQKILVGSQSQTVADLVPVTQTPELQTANNSWGTYGMIVLGTGGGTAESYLPCAIDAEDYAAVDAGNCFVETDEIMQAYSTGDDDTGRSYIEFRDASDALIGTREYTLPAEIEPSVDGTAVHYRTAVPAGTRTIRYGLVGTEVASGSVIHPYRDRIAVWLERPY